VLTHDRVIAPDELVGLIDAVDVATVRKVAGRLLSGGQPTLAAVGSVDQVPDVDWIAERIAAPSREAPQRRLGTTG